MEKLRLKKSNIAALIIVIMFYLAEQLVYFGKTFYPFDLNGFAGLIDLFTNVLSFVLIALIMTYEKDEERSFKITAVGCGALLLLNPTLAFPFVPMAAGICLSGRLLTLNFDEGAGLKKAAVIFGFYLAGLPVIFFELKYNFYPLINVYTLNAALHIYLSVVVSGIVALLFYLFASKLKIKRLELILAVLWLVYFSGTAVFMFKCFNMSVIASARFITLPAMMIIVYKLFCGRKQILKVVQNEK